MQRRSFFGALVALVAAPKVLLEAAKQKRAAYVYRGTKTPLPSVQWRDINAVRSGEPFDQGSVQCRIQVRESQWHDGGRCFVLQKRVKELPWIDWEWVNVPPSFRGDIAFNAVPNVVFPVIT